MGGAIGSPAMKIAHVLDAGGERWWGVLDLRVPSIRRIAGSFDEWAPLFLASGRLAEVRLGGEYPLACLRLLAPVPDHGRIFGVGLNYLAHTQRLGMQKTPPHTLGYLKPHSAIVGPGEDIDYPPVTVQLDFELELVAVVARPLGDVTRATDCLLGYTIGNDISARDAGRRLGVLDVFTQKALDRTAPVGPWIVTADEIGGRGQPEVDMTLRVNGEIRQQDNTRHMLFPVEEILNYLDARVALRGGDVVFTGSPAGVGKEDGRYLKPGDILSGEIAGIGSLENRVGAKRRLTPARAVGRLGIGTKLPDGTVVED